MLGSYTSRIGDKLPSPGPTLTNFYMPDLDRHKSGLFCQGNNHLRSILEDDTEVAPLRYCQEKADYLTDSESDNEEAYHYERPSIYRVREMLQLPLIEEIKVEEIVDSKGSKKGVPLNKKQDSKVAETKPPAVSITVPAASAAVGSPVSPLRGVDDAFSVLDDSLRKFDQVELLRDRKGMDLNLYMRKHRQELEDTYVQR